jgi:hypothetical protein
MTTDHRTTPAAKKVTAVLFFLFMILFFKYKPYEHAHFVAHTAAEYLFVLYFFVSNQTLGMVHEAGHGICYLLPCPQFITALNGTLFQVLFPALVGYYYKRKGKDFAFWIGLFFVGFSLQYTAWYISTAHLASHVSASESFLGVDGYHDFNYLLTRLHLLEYDGWIAALTRFAATALMVWATFKMALLAFFASGDAPRSRRRIRNR